MKIAPLQNYHKPCNGAILLYLFILRQVAFHCGTLID
nr:MAG TPA: hypothetical protein [Caudoviricetes sp.]